MGVLVRVLLAIACVPGFLCSAFAADLYTVRLEDFASRAELLEFAAAHATINDLWMQQDGGAFKLNAGIFPEKKYATMLQQRLQDRKLSGKILPVEMPGADQWLPVEEIISLGDLGHDKPVLMQGVQAYTSFHFPWNSSLSVQGGVLHLRVKSSRYLKEDSIVTVLVEGVPLLSVSTAVIGRKMELAIPLDSVTESEIGKTLDVEISAALSATDDRCVDMLSRHLWLVVDAQSRVQVTRRAPPRSAREFFSDPSDTFSFSALAENAESVGAMNRIAGLIGSLSRSRFSRLHFNEYLVAAKNIFIGSFPDDIRVLGSNIFVSPHGADLLASRWFPALIFSRLNGNLGKDTPSESAIDVSFEQLGYSHRTARGVGDLSFFVEFSTLEIGGWPENFLCTLVYIHTPVRQRERAFLRVRLNGVLVESREIHGDGGQRSLVFALPTRYFQEKNSLEIMFSYYLNIGDCTGSYPEFEVALSKDSFLTVDGYDPSPPLNLSTWPAIFTGKGALVLGGFSPELYRPAARLMELQGFLQQSTPDISLIEMQELGTGAFDYAVVVTKPEQASSLSPPVDLVPALQIKNPLTKTVLLSLDTTEAATVIQTFRGKDSELPILLYGQRTSSLFPAASLTRLLTSSSRANVGIIHEGQWYAMEIGNKFQVIYPDRHDFFFYWARYRLLFFIFIGAAALIFFFYVYHRLAKEK